VSQIAARTLLSPRIVYLLDEGRFADLPGGVYARSYVRACASVVDLNPDAVVAELEQQLPVAGDPFPALLAIARARDPWWVVALEDAAASVRRSLGENTARVAASTRGSLGRLTQAAADALLLIGLLFALIQLTALTCGVDSGALLRLSGAPLAAIWGLFVTSYLTISRFGALRAGVIVKIPRGMEVRR
jgi:hypothetical protein